MIEIWKDIDWLDGYFQVSNTGKIRSVNREIIYNNGKIYNYRGKEYVPANNKGYSVQNINLCGKQICIRIHREVAKAFIPNPNNLPEINHKDLDKKNNNTWNLEWCTRKENVNHFMKYSKKK